MDILKAEIAKKRKLLEEKNIIVSMLFIKPVSKEWYFDILINSMFICRLQDPNKPRKYFKRGELLAKEQEEYFKKYGLHNNQDEAEKTEASSDKG